MRQGVILIEDSIDGFQALGAFGQPVHESYVQLRAAIERRLGTRYANFFARPQIDDRAKRIRWVAPVPGQAVSWRDLSREEQAERALDLQIMRGGFDQYLKELAAENGQSRGKSGGEAFAAVLSQALRTPNDGHLHFIGDQPITTFWGFSEHGSPGFEPLAVAPRADALAPAAPAVPLELPGMAASATTEAPVAAPRRRWWWWLLGLLALLLLLLLLFFLWPTFLTRIGITLPFLPKSPPITAPEEPRSGTEPPTEDQPIERDGMVVRPGSPGGVVLPDGTVEVPGGQGESVVPVEPAIPDPGTPGVGPEGTEVPPVEKPTPPASPELQTEPEPPADETAPEPPQPPQLEPEPPPGAEAPGGADSLAIPESTARGTGPVDFLQGRWRSQSGLVDDSGRKLDLFYEFDKAGRGRSIVRRADGVECRAPAEARMQGGRLEVQELEDLRCADGQLFEKTTTTCQRDAAGRTQCRGAYEGGRGFDVQIDRAKP
jgi:hypothetical protein